MPTTTPTSPMDSLRDEHKAMGCLLDLIKQEQAQLIDANIDALKQLTEEKTKVVSHMSALAVQRDATLAAAGFQGTADTSAIKLWLSKAGTPAEKLWDELLAMAASAKELNRVNGMLINKHMTHNQNTLNALHATPQGSNLYGPTGQSSTKTSSRRLVVG